MANRLALQAQLRDEVAQLRDIRASISTAQSDYDAAKQRLEALVADEARVAKRVQSLQGTLHPLAGPAYPDDILSHIFQLLSGDLSDDHKHWDPFGPKFDMARAKAPFLLAAISTKWRKIALEMPRLWTYVGIQAGIRKEMHPAWTFYLELALARSKVTPIIVVALDTMIPGPVLQPLLDASSRWRRAALDYSPAQEASIVRALCGPTPVLERLWWRGGCDSEEFPYLLPHCPKLRWYYSHGAPMWSPNLPATNLRTLAIEAVIAPISKLFGTLSRCPRLKELNLDVILKGVPQSEPSVTLSELTSLCIAAPDTDISSILNFVRCAISMPKLASLDLSAVEGLELAFDDLAHQITVLELSSVELDLDQYDAEVIGRLTGLKELTVHNSTIEDLFFTHLIETRPWLLPSLSSLTLYDTCHVTPSGGASLYGFLQARKDAHERAPADAPVSMLSTVNIMSQSLAQWVNPICELVRASQSTSW